MYIFSLLNDNINHLWVYSGVFNVITDKVNEFYGKQAHDYNFLHYTDSEH